MESLKIAWSQDANVAERQMQAVIFCLVAFGYIDNDFDGSERAFIRDLIGRCVTDRASTIDDETVRRDVAMRWNEHYLEVMVEMDRNILSHFSESVGEGESTNDFVLAKLKLGCFELLQGFGHDDREALLGAIDRLMHSDGVVHPNELAFREEVDKLLEEPIHLDDADLQAVPHGQVVIGEQHSLEPRVNSHPLLTPSEWDFADDPQTFAMQAAGDVDLMKRVIDTLAAQREAGRGKLAAANGFTDFFGQPPFLDEHVYVFQPNPTRKVELLVIGDLHGCYSCLKAALMQSDFFRKVENYKLNPDRHVAPYLVLLGDYIDRGRFSYTGILRTVMQLFVNMPEHVFMLRGNHEYYLELKGQVLAAVRPCEAIDSIKSKADKAVLAAYMNLFEALPNMLVFDKTFFVHGGIPRDATLEQKWQGLHSLNDRLIRFEMMWSDPSDADVIPADLQAQNARFPFGRKQFASFMNRVGCTTMVRGHERVIEGFRKIYDGDEGVLCSVFSAGGKHNEDLPKRSNYRDVNPKAVIVSYADGVSTFKPFALDYRRYNDPNHNAFFKS